MTLGAAMPYKITSQVINGYINLGRLFASMPDGWSLAVRNCSGAALSTGCVVAYRPLTYTIA